MAISRYRNVNIVDEPGSSRFYETIDFPTQSEIDAIPTIKIRISQFDRLDNLAFKHLGAGEYWWVIALVNDIDWMYEFTAGDVIKIPVNVDDILRLV